MSNYYQILFTIALNRRFFGAFVILAIELLILNYFTNDNTIGRYILILKK